MKPDGGEALRNLSERCWTFQFVMSSTADVEPGVLQQMNPVTPLE